MVCENHVKFKQSTIKAPEYKFILSFEYAGISLRERIMNIIKVSANSRTAAVAGAIAGVVREHKLAEVQSIGAGAVNQAVKALILAKGYLANDGIDIVFVPEFVDVEIDEKVRTAIKITVIPRTEALVTDVLLTVD
jgi:stage V sporulation protein S